MIQHGGVKVWGVSPGFVATQFADWTEDEMREASFYFLLLFGFLPIPLLLLLLLP